jgi:hypothetical protein
MNILLNIDEATPEFSVKATSPFSVEIDFVARRSAAARTSDGASATAKTYTFVSGDIGSVESTFESIEAAMKRGAK